MDFKRRKLEHFPSRCEMCIHLRGVIPQNRNPITMFICAMKMEEFENTHLTCPEFELPKTDYGIAILE